MVVKRKTKPKRKVKKKQPTQKQKQTQRQSVTVNINTKGQTKRKAPRASANSNTSRVLQQFAQPIITLPSNLINPPSMPQAGLNRSPLQSGTNQGLTGNVIGEDLAERERLRAGLNARKNDEQSLSGFSDSLASGSADGSFYNMGSNPPSTTGLTNFSVGSMSRDSLGNYSKPPSSTGLTNFSVGSSNPSSSTASSSDFTVGSVPPVSDFVRNYMSEVNELARGGVRRTRTTPIAQGQQNITSFFGGSVGGLSAEPPQPVGVPSAGNPALKTGSAMEFLPRRPLSDLGTGGTLPMADVDTRSYSSY